MSKSKVPSTNSYYKGVVRNPSLGRHKQCPLLPQKLASLLGPFTELR